MSDPTRYTDHRKLGAGWLPKDAHGSNVSHLDRCAWWCADCETGDCAVTRMPMQVAAAGHAADYPGHEVIVEVNGEVVAAWGLP